LLAAVAVVSRRWQVQSPTMHEPASNNLASQACDCSTQLCAKLDALYCAHPVSRSPYSESCF